MSAQEDAFIAGYLYAAQYNWHSEYQSPASSQSYNDFDTWRNGENLGTETFNGIPHFQPLSEYFNNI